MALMPPEEIDFTLDRLFLFAVPGADGSPLIVGVVSPIGELSRLLENRIIHLKGFIKQYARDSAKKCRFPIFFK